MFCKLLHDNPCSSYTNVYGPVTTFEKHVDPIVSYTGVRYKCSHGLTHFGYLWHDILSFPLIL